MRASVVLAALGVLAVAAPAAAEPSAAKRQLIVELLDLSGSGSSERVAQLFLLQIRGAYAGLVETVLASETELPPEQLEALRRHLADFDSFGAAFSERFPERIDLDALLESVYVPLYDEHFEEEELRAIVAFYHSPVGRKTLEVMPRLLQQGIDNTLPIVEPQVLALVGEILGERRQQVLE
jgi:hypothetical protein